MQDHTFTLVYILMGFLGVYSIIKGLIIIYEERELIEFQKQYEKSIEPIMADTSANNTLVFKEETDTKISSKKIHKKRSKHRV